MHKKFALGDYQLIDSIEITEDNISFNSVTVHALFLELPTEKLELNKPLDIRTNTDGRPITNRGYYVEGSSETEYTFIFNQGAVSNYDSKYGSDYFSARVYKADGSLITVVSSKQLGGRFTVLRLLQANLGAIVAVKIWSCTLAYMCVILLYLSLFFA